GYGAGSRSRSPGEAPCVSHGQCHAAAAGPNAAATASRRPGGEQCWPGGATPRNPPKPPAPPFRAPPARPREPPRRHGPRGRHGVTLGSPVAIRIGNTEWPKWDTVMAPDPVPAGVLDELARAAPLTRPRPGHADLAGMQKYGHHDARPVLERASARETAARV